MVALRLNLTNVHFIYEGESVDELLGHRVVASKTGEMFLSPFGLVQFMLVYLRGVSGLDAGRQNFFKIFEKKMDEKRDRLKESSHQLAVSCALCAVCLLGHVSHIFAAKPPWIHVFHSVGFHVSLSLFTLLGPGRQLILDGVKSLSKGAPNMNTLVGLGALSSFAVSSLAALIPKLDLIIESLRDWTDGKVIFSLWGFVKGFVKCLQLDVELQFADNTILDLKDVLRIKVLIEVLDILHVGLPVLEHIDEEILYKLKFQHHWGACSPFPLISGVLLLSLCTLEGWKAFFEEPIMLIAFVLLGRNLEQRAKIKATSDMTGLLSVLPTKARLVVNGDAKDLGSIVEVPCSSLSVGDKIVVLPGDRVPADGTVTAGRSTIDESSFTGEPLPLTKLPGSQVSAGSINLNGTLTIEVKRPGGETTMGDIVRLVEEAQSREAPVQRLADKVSSITFGVWALYLWGDDNFSSYIYVLEHVWDTHSARSFEPRKSNFSSSTTLLQCFGMSLIMVVACPCALGLATPTAVLVGTSLGATRGLLLRGGNVLEKFSMVNSVVFDKTGTLTIGRPAVTKVVPLGGMKITDSQLNPDATLSEVELLKLAASVESNTIHPVGKAIVEAAQAAGCQNVKDQQKKKNQLYPDKHELDSSRDVPKLLATEALNLPHISIPTFPKSGAAYATTLDVMFPQFFLEDKEALMEGELLQVKVITGN
ncbi:hypothetical protein POTOM_005151 [Populus tomentosa]|uniref:P-type ATPase A domain-containing protein n=1 Tax=Populus tomentosa TaxID=118781 RepID=A0A8X8DE93_POPTO|nr:hypothetical protein POTOM_005151 [Populus tomentosa]